MKQTRFLTSIKRRYKERTWIFLPFSSSTFSPSSVVFLLSWSQPQLGQELTLASWWQPCHGQGTGGWSGGVSRRAGRQTIFQKKRNKMQTIFQKKEKMQTRFLRWTDTDETWKGSVFCFSQWYVSKTKFCSTQVTNPPLVWAVACIHWSPKQLKGREKGGKIVLELFREILLRTLPGGWFSRKMLLVRAAEKRGKRIAAIDIASSEWGTGSLLNVERNSKTEFSSFHDSSTAPSRCQRRRRRGRNH